MTHTMLDEMSDLAAISAAAVSEVQRVDPAAALDCAGWPTAADLIAHLGSHFGWVVAMIGATDRPARPTPPSVGMRRWFTQERDRFIEVVRSTDPSTPAFTPDGSGQFGFWVRRSIFEVGRHVWDFRTAGGHRPAPPPELSAARYADGVTEHFDVFLTRSRSALEPLPGTLRLEATDTTTTWTLTTDWERRPSTPDATVRAAAGDLALLCWERADALAQPGYHVTGSPEVLAAFQAAPIHR